MKNKMVAGFIKSFVNSLVSLSGKTRWRFL